MWLVNQLKEILILLATVVVVCIGVVLGVCVLVAASPIIAVVAVVGGVGVFFLWCVGVIGGKHG